MTIQVVPVVNLLEALAMQNADDSNFLAHFESPYHRGRLADPSAAQHLRNSACGDWVNLEVRLADGDRIEAIFFEGQGCIVSQAAASILCERVEGRTLEELAALGPQDMLGWIDVPLLARRWQCALLAFRALKMIVYTRKN